MRNTNADPRVKQAASERMRKMNKARRHLRDEAELAEKNQRDIQNLGQSGELDAVHAGQLKLQSASVIRRS